MPNGQKGNPNNGNPPPNFGIQYIPDGTYVNMPDGSKHSVNDDYGNGRIRMNPVNDEMANDGSASRQGYYLHGKGAWYNRTHGCVCDKSETIFNYFWSGDGKDVRGQVPFAVDVPVVLPEN